jgi:hypothetical protein
MMSLEGRRHHERRTGRTGTELHALLISAMLVKVWFRAASFVLLRCIIVVVWLLLSSRLSAYGGQA